MSYLEKYLPKENAADTTTPYLDKYLPKEGVSPDASKTAKGLPYFEAHSQEIEREAYDDTQEDAGFFSNVGSLLKSGARGAFTGMRVADDVAAGRFDPETPGLISGELNRIRPQPKELRDAQDRLMRFTDEWDEAQGLGESLGVLGRMVWDIGKEAVTNPKGLVYFTAEQAANMAPGIVGMLAGGKVGALGGPLAPVTVPVGALTGAFAGQWPIEAGQEFVGYVGEELHERGLAWTERNIAAILQEPETVTRLVGQARRKATGTAATDAALTMVGGKIASAPARAAQRQAVAKLGSGATREAIEAETKAILAKTPKAQRVGMGLAGGAVDVAGEGISEGVGQKWATGEVDMGEVALEMFGGLGGAAIEVPAAMRALRERPGVPGTRDSGGEPSTPAVPKGALEKAVREAALPAPAPAVATAGGMTAPVTAQNQEAAPVQTGGGMTAPVMGKAALDVRSDIEQGGVRDDLYGVRQEVGRTAQEVPAVRGADVAQATPIDAQAHEAASSPANNTPEPTPAQIEAGNYKKGKIRLHGLDISIENPAGSTRKGTDETGRPWSTDLASHYGYIRGTVGRDKDHLDVFVKPGIDKTTAGESVFVVDQKNVKTGRFDEHKVLMGFSSLDEARQAYLANYDETGPQRIGAITEVPVAEFRRWLKEGNTKAAFARQNTVFPTEADISERSLADRLAALGVGKDSDLHQELIQERRKSMRQPDPVTGLQKVDYHRPTLDRAWGEHQESGRSFAYADVDVRNLGGLNDFAGANARADVHLRAIADILSEVLAGRAQLFRKGGDEFGVIAPDLNEKQLMDLLAKASARIDNYVRKNNLATIPHPKGKRPGVGIYYGVVDFGRYNNIERVIEAADSKTAASKKDQEAQHVRRGQTETAGAGQDQRSGRTEAQTGRAGQAGQAGQTAAEEIARTAALVALSRLRLVPTDKKRGGAPIFKASRIDPSIRRTLEAMRGEIDASELVASVVIPGGYGMGGTSEGVAAGGSTFPAYFQNKGYTKRQALLAIDNYLAGKGVTTNRDGSLGGQVALLVDLVGSKRHSDAGRLSDLRREQIARRRQEADLFAVDETAKAESIALAKELYAHLTDEEAAELLRNDMFALAPVETIQRLEEDYADTEGIDRAAQGDVAARAKGDAARAGEPAAQERVLTERTEAGEQVKLFPTPPTFGRKPTQGEAVTSLDFELPVQEPGLFDRQPEAKAEPKAPAVNTIFTEDAYQKARARMREKLSRVHSGFDPELMQDGLTIAGYHLEKGARSFAAYAKQMVAEFGEGIKPYLKAFYNGVRDLPGIAWTKEMDAYQAVAEFDLGRLESAEGKAAEGEARPERFEIGKSLTKEQRKQVLATLTDVYVENHVEKEMRLDARGEEYWVFPHTPEFFLKSDITGAMIRYYVTLPDGQIAHPSELFPEMTQAKIDAALAEAQEKLRQAESAKKEMDSKVDRWADADRMRARANTIEGQKSYFQHGGPERYEQLKDLYSEKEGKWFVTLIPDQAVKLLADRGYRQVKAYRRDGEKWLPKEYVDSLAEEVKAPETSDTIEKESPQQGDAANDSSSRADLERDRRDAEAANRVGEEGLSDVGRRDDEGTRERSERAEEAQFEPGRDPLLPRRETATPGERGNPPVPAEQQSSLFGERLAGSEFGERGNHLDVAGAATDPVAAAAVERAAQRVAELRGREAAQLAAQSVQIVPGDSANIDKSLPLLLPGQREDVAFAEARFAKPDGYGVMFTNGTGTGKTFSGLGIVKRFERQGKKNTLIVAPGDNVISDWIKSGHKFSLDISPLAGVKDAGDGIVITTYENFGQNEALVSRVWDLVVFDESHKLNSNKSGEPTKAQEMMRALTLHPEGSFLRARLLNPELSARMDEARSSKDEARMRALDLEWQKARDAVRAEVDAAQGEARSRVVFLSATPFAYDKNIEYAQGYLFDWNEGQPQDGYRSYNSGSNRERFFMQHFGYRMRYNKLTEPSAEVDQGVMQRQFNSYLKQQKVLSGRLLDVEPDYDRRFVLVESAIGRKIDEGLDFLRENHETYGTLYQRVMKTFDYLNRRFLLEAIKAKEAIPHIREHLALGRKVVVFHDYKAGGGVNPFDVRTLIGNGEEVFVGKYPHQTATTLGEVAQQFVEARPDLVELPFGSYGSALSTLQAAFPDALIVNGDRSKGENIRAAELFQDDESGRNLIVVQSDKGKEGISLHDTTGKHQRVLFNLGLPIKPTMAIQQEGRIYRTGQVSNAIMRYLNTGTNWERYAFATTIARRASGAENLASGEQARILLDAFVQGFEESDNYRAGHEGEGTGGKERDKAANAALTEWDRAITYYFSQQKKTGRTKAAEGVDYFATPEPLGLKMAEWADIRPGESVLEPSGGHGAIARWFPDLAKRRLIEPSLELSSRAALVFDGDIVQGRFEDHNVVNKYDVVVMNPPFGQGGKTAVDHLEKASMHLKEGGRIVALLPRGPAADKRFDGWLYAEDDKGRSLRPDLHLVADIELPAATFERAGTKVATRIVVLDKGDSAPAQVNRDYSDADSIKDFFERLEHATIPERMKVEAAPEAEATATNDRPAPTAPKIEGGVEIVSGQFEHTKSGKQMYAATVETRLDDAAYKQALALAKNHGGYYSSYNKRGAIRGFLFDAAENRDAFVRAMRRDEAQAADEAQGAPKFSVEAQTILRGDNGLGKVEVAPARSLPFIRKLLERENLEQVTVKGGNVDALREVAKAFGKTVVFFRGRDAGDGLAGAGDRAAAGVDRVAAQAGDSGSGGRGVINGFIHPGRPDLIYLNVDAPNHLLFIAGHELNHALKMDDPALYAQMAAELQPLVRKWSEYSAKLNDPRYAQLSEQEKAEELFGDVVGDNFLNEAFWKEMAEQNVTIFRKVARKAVALLNKALRLFTGRDASRYVSDMEQARAIIARTLVEYGQKAQRGVYEQYAKQADAGYLAERIDGHALLAKLNEMGISNDVLMKAFEGIGGARFAVSESELDGNIRYSLSETAKAEKSFLEKLTPDKDGLVYQVLSNPPGLLPERVKSAVGMVLSNPHYGAKVSKWRGAAYQMALERAANANEIKYEVMSTKGDYEGLEGVRKYYRKASRAERTMIDKLLVEGDIQGRVYTAEDLNSENNPLGRQAPLTVQAAYFAFRQTLERSTEVMFDQLGRLRLIPYEGTAYHRELIGLLDEGLSVDEVARRFGINEKAVEAYMQIRRSRAKLDELTKPYRDQPWYSALRDALVKGLTGVQMQAEFGKSPDLLDAYREIQKQGRFQFATAEKYKKAAWYKTLVDLLTVGDDHPMLQKLELFNAYRGVVEYDSQLAKLKNEWGKVKGYLPRIRKDGEQHVKVWRVEEDGTFTEVWMQPAKTKVGAETLRKKVAKNLQAYFPHSYDPDAHYEVVVEPNTATPEEIFLGIGSHRAIEGLLSKVFDRATDAGIIEDQLAVQQQVLRILADEISARGFGRHRLSRAEHLIEGYETQNTPAILAQFIGGMAGWISKSEFAMRANRLMSQIPATKPEDKRWVLDYVGDALKNSTYVDQWFGTARSFAALMYLGFKASSAALNATQNYVWGQAKLSLYTKGATRKILQAQAEVVKDHLLIKAGRERTLSAEDQWVLEEGLRRGRSHANYVRAMSGTDETGGVLGKGQAGIRWMTEKAMIPFQMVETHWNRESALLASFRVFRNEHGLSKEEALKKAEGFVDDVHFVVAKENIPALLRKMGPLGRTLYVFQSYPHNYLLGILTSLKKGEFGVVARSMTALVLFGGLLAIPFGDDLDKWYRRVFGERPLRMLDRWLRATAHEYTDFGDQIADFVMHGAPALAGVNWSGALSVNVSWFSPEDDSLAERVTGVWGGMAQKVRFAAEAASKGDLRRASEFVTPEFIATILRAHRLYTQGTTTFSGRPVFGDDGRQVRYTAKDAVIRSFGFMPLEPSKQTRNRWDARLAREFWTERKSDVLAQYRTAKDKRKALEKVREFNRELRNAPGGVLVPPIDGATLLQALRAKPDKREMLYLR